MWYQKYKKNTRVQKKCRLLFLFTFEVSLVLQWDIEEYYFKAAVLGFRPFTRPARRAPARWKLLAARHRQRQRKSLHGTPPKQSGADYSPWLGRRKRSPEPRSVLRYWQRWAGLPVLTDLIKPEIPRNAEVDDDDSIADPQWAKRYRLWMVKKNG